MNAVTKIADNTPSYTYWQNALAGTFGPVHDGDPQLGFFRKRTSRAGPFVPVAIWAQDGKVIALVDGKEADAADIWTFVCKYPIAEDWYHTRMRGEPWPDEDNAVSASLAPPSVGHNNPPADEAEILQGQIDAATAGADAYAEINDDESAAKAQSLRSRLLELSGKADKLREDRKRPHLEAGKLIDAALMPLVKNAKNAADAIRTALGAHETRKAREAERIRKAAEDARIKAEREAVKAAADAALKGGVAPEPAPTPAPPPPVPVPETSTAIRGAYGRAAAVKVVKVARVVDQDKAYMSMRTHKELVELIAKLAQRAATAGVEVAGVEVTEERAVA